MTNPAATYAPGSGTAVVGPSAMALVLGAADGAAQSSIRAPILDGSPFSAIVGQLSAVGLEALPALAVVVFEAEGPRLLVRGEVEAVVVTSEGSTVIVSGRSVSTWHEEHVPEAASVTLRLVGTETQATFTLGAGTAPAEMLARDVSAIPEPTTGTASPMTPPAPQATNAPPPVTPPSVPPPPLPPSPAATPAAPAAPLAPPAVEGDDFDFGHLLGETRHRMAEDAAVRAPSEASDESSSSPPVDAPPSSPAPPSATEATPPAAPSPDETRYFDDDARPGSGLISAVPGIDSISPSPAPPVQPVAPNPPPITALPVPAAASASPGPTVAPPPAQVITTPPAAPTTAPTPPPPIPAPVEEEEEEDSATRRRPTGPSAAVGRTPAPEVQAVHCAQQHPNPPHASTCRRCGQTLTDRQVRNIPRPSLGRLVFPSGRSIDLTRPIIMGRKPPASAVVEGEPADSIALKDPEKLLSRVHVEIRLVDWQVQLVDRDSMNHTYIEIPGHAPLQLRPADPHPIPPGTTINLADAIRMTYLVGEE